MNALLERPQVMPITYEQTMRKSLESRLTEQSDALADLRLKALSRFELLGVPTRRLEAWKYLNLRPLIAQAMSSVSERQAETSVTLKDIKAHVLADDSVMRMVFVNGQYNEQLSTLQSIEGLTIECLSSVCQSVPLNLRTLLETNLDAEQDAFVALNTALFSEGVYISVAEQTEIQPLIQLLFVNTGSVENHLPETHLRNLFVLGQNSKAQFLIQHVGLKSSNAEKIAYFQNTVNQFSLGAGAQAEATLVLSESQNAWHLANTRSSLQADAQLTVSTVTMDGLVNRHSISSLLQGEKAALHLNGLDVLDGNTEVYHHTVTEHWVPNTTSDQTYKGLLDESGKSEFNSIVFVAKGADGTDSHQLHKALLLSEDAHIWTRPQLQINADDVKCAHGAAVGQLDEDQLFYLASRGLSAGLAKSLLTYGFAEDVIQKVSNPLVQKYLDIRVLEHLHGACSIFKRDLQKELGV